MASKLAFDTPALAFLGLAAVGGYFLLKDNKASAKEPLPDFTADGCEKILQALPEPFKSVLNAPTTDLSNPATLEYLATQLDNANQTKAAQCLRTFKEDIAKAAKDGSVPINCEDLIGAATFLTEEQRALIRSSIANPLATRQDLHMLAETLRTAGKATSNADSIALADCIDAVGAEKASSSVSGAFKEAFLDAFAPKKSLVPLSEDASLAKKV